MYFQSHIFKDKDEIKPFKWAFNSKHQQLHGECRTYEDCLSEIDRCTRRELAYERTSISH